MLSMRIRLCCRARQGIRFSRRRSGLSSVPLPPLRSSVGFISSCQFHNSICLPSKLHFVLLRAGGEKCTLTNFYSTIHGLLAASETRSTFEVERDWNLIGLIDRLLHFLNSSYLSNHGKRDAVLQHSYERLETRRDYTAILRATIPSKTVTSNNVFVL